MTDKNTGSAGSTTPPATAATPADKKPTGDPPKPKPAPGSFLYLTDENGESTDSQHKDPPGPVD